MATIRKRLGKWHYIKRNIN